MKKNVLVLGITFGLCVSASAQQNTWTAMPYASHQLIHGDLGYEHPTRTFSPGVGFQLQYGIFKNGLLYGDLNYGSVNGGNDSRYYEAQYLQSLLGFQYDVIRAMAPNSGFGLSADLSMGWNMFASNGYQGSDDALLARVPNEGAASHTPVLGLGVVMGITLSEKVELNLAYRNLYQAENDWVDAFENGEAMDHMGQISLGIRFSLNSKTRKMEIPEQEYNQLLSSVKKAEEERDEAQERLEQSRLEYDTKIDDLYNVLSVMRNSIDSLNAKITILDKMPGTDNQYTVRDQGGRPGTIRTPGSSAGALWRIIIGSFPTAKAANDFAHARTIEGGNYEVVYISDLNTYRVVYDSYPTLSAARKEISRIRQYVSDAWIIKF